MNRGIESLDEQGIIGPGPFLARKGEEIVYLRDTPRLLAKGLGPSALPILSSWKRLPTSPGDGELDRDLDLLDVGVRQPLSVFRHAGDVTPNGLLDILKGLLSGSALGMTPRQRRAADRNEPVFVSGKGNRELQHFLLPS